MPALLRIIIFIFIVTAVYTGIHYFTAIWVIRHFTLPFSNKAIRLFFIISALCFPLSAILVRNFPNIFTQIFNIICYVWMGIIFIWFCLSFSEMLAEFVYKLLSPKVYPKLISGFIVIGITGFLSVFALFNAAKTPHFKKLEIPVKNLPAEMENLTVAVLSDTHLCHLVPLKKFKKVVKRINTLNPDILIHLGDFIESDSGYDDKIAKIMQTINPKYGKFAVFGNHEFYFGLKKSKQFYINSGFKMLRQEIIELPNGLQIAGFDDIHTAGIKSEKINEVLSKLNPQKPALVLTHQPLFFDEIAKHNPSLVLSGHTHAGQLFPFIFFVKWRYPYIYGLFKIAASYFYVTSGTFYWGPPMRLFTKSEVPMFTFKKV